MIKNIKSIWNSMLPETKKEVVQSIIDSKEFEAQSEIAIKQNWIYQGRIPERHQERVLGIFQQALKAQLEKSTTIWREKIQ